MKKNKIEENPKIDSNFSIYLNFEKNKAGSLAFLKDLHNFDVPKIRKVREFIDRREL